MEGRPAPSVELPILGDTPDRSPIALISPTNTMPGLTHASGGSAPGRPGPPTTPAESGTSCALVGPDELSGRRRCSTHHAARSCIACSSSTTPRRAGLDVAGGFKRAARHLRLPLAGSASWNVSQSTFEALANRVARAHPDGVLLAGLACPDCGALIKALNARIPDARLISDDGFGPADSLVQAVGAGAERHTT